MASQLNGKVAIVTGSSAGIGEAIAVLFASRGAKVTLCGRDKERLKSVFDKVVKVCGGHKDRVLIVEGDLNDKKIRQELVTRTVETFGHLDILVANAGVSGNIRSFVYQTEESYDKVLNTNLKSVFFLIQLAVPHLEKSKGNIVNISSIGSSMALPVSLPYMMSKAALDHLTRCLAVDLGSKGIRVNSVNPGYFPTLILRDIDYDKDAFAKDEYEKLPLKGRIATLEDVAEAVAFLATDSAGFITGELIKVDGGRSFVGSNNK